MKRERIVFVLPQLKTGGGVRVIVELANVLAERHEVKIVLPKGKVECTFAISDRIIIEQVGREPVSALQKVANIFRTVAHVQKVYQNDNVIVTDPIQSPLFIFARMPKLYRFVQADDYRIFDDLLLLKNRFFLYLYKAVTKLSYRKKIGYLFNSAFTHEMFERHSGRKVPQKIVHPALNRKVFYPYEAEKPQRDSVRLCLIARKHPMKRFGDFVEVYQRLMQNPKVAAEIEKVTVISHDDLSSYATAGMERVVPSCDKDIADVMNSSDIYIFTSLWEGFGLPPLEAMGCGCAVVASDAGGISEYAVNGENALIYPPADTDALYDAIVRLIEDRALLQRLRINGMQTARNFSWERSAKMVEKYLFEKENDV